MTYSIASLDVTAISSFSVFSKESSDSLVSIIFVAYVTGGISESATNSCQIDILFKSSKSFWSLLISFVNVAILPLFCSTLVDKIEKYVEFLNQNEDFITKYYDIGDGLSVSFRRANVK